MRTRSFQIIEAAARCLSLDGRRRRFGGRHINPPSGLVMVRVWLLPSSPKVLDGNPRAVWFRNVASERRPYISASTGPADAPLTMM